MSDEQPPPHEHPPPGGGIGGGQECLICPLCVLLQALTTARPEVTEHLLAAAKEVTLALQRLVETQTNAHDAASDHLERVDVD